MHGRRWLIMGALLLLLSACGAAQEQVIFADLVEDASRYDQQEVRVLGYYYQDDTRQILVVGVRTDDGFQNPVPLGDALWVEGMPEEVVEQLNFASGAAYGIVEAVGRFETGGGFGADGSYPSRLVITDPEQVVALEAAQMEEAWVPADLGIPGAVTLAELIASPDLYSGQVVTLAAYYYWTPSTYVLAEGIRSLDGVHNAVPIGQQIWVEAFPPSVSGELNVLQNNVHGLVQVSGRFETRGSYGPNGAYPYRLVVESAEPIRP